MRIRTFSPYFKPTGFSRWLFSAIDAAVLKQAQYLTSYGVGHFDALHVSCAMAGYADVFVTTDDRLLKRLKIAGGVVAMLPQEAIAFLENWYEN